MKDLLSDKTVIIAIFATLLLVFTLIFSTRPNQQILQPSIEWRDSPNSNYESLKI